MTFPLPTRIIGIMHEKSDSQLVQEALAGDPRAFRLLVERTQGMVYRLAFRFLRDIHETEDVVQEVYIKVWGNLKKYRDSAKLTTWIYTITVRTCLDILKSKKQKMTPIRSIDTLPEASAHPETIMDRKELKERIIIAAERLTPKQKTVFVMRDLEGLSMDEISEILAMPKGNVKSNLYYARRRIHALVSKDYDILIKER